MKPMLLTAGPFRFFRHAHRFVSVEDGTKMEDEINFETRFGRFADMVAKAYLARLMRTRNEAIKGAAQQEVGS